MILAGGLLGGAIVHIVVVLAFPNYAGRDLWNALADYGPPSEFALIPTSMPGEEEIAYLDPTMIHMVCRVDLVAGPHRVTSQVAATYWSIGVLDRRGRSLYGVNSSTAGGAAIDLLLISSTDLEALRRSPPAILEESIIVDLSVSSAIVVLRAFVRDETMRATVIAEMRAAECAGPLDIQPAPETPPAETPAEDVPVVPDPEA